MRNPLILALMLGLAAAALPPPAAAQLGTKEGLEQGLSQGSEAYARGLLDDAILYWTGALDAAKKLGDAPGQIDILARRADAYRTLGYLTRSLTDLKAAIGLAEAEGAEDALAALKSGLGTAYLLSGEQEAARAESLRMARSDSMAQAEALYDPANFDSIRVSGATNSEPSFGRFSSGPGNACRSTLPFWFKGISSRGTK